GRLWPHRLRIVWPTRVKKGKKCLRDFPGSGEEVSGVRDLDFHRQPQSASPTWSGRAQAKNRVGRCRRCECVSMDPPTSPRKKPSLRKNRYRTKQIQRMLHVVKAFQCLLHNIGSSHRLVFLE